MRIALSFVVALIACVAGCKDKAAKAKPGPVAAAVAIDAAVAPVAVALDAAAGPAIDAAPAPLTPAAGPRGVQIIDLQYGGYAAPGLPAIKDDGSEVVAVAVADDGGRGYLDLTVLVLDGATGRVRTRLHLADANETSDAEQKDDQAGNFAVEEALFATVRERVGQANARVTAGVWRSLVTTTRDDDAGPPGPNESIVVGDLTFGYDLGKRRLTVTRAGKTVATHDFAKLVASAAPRTDTPCPGDLAYLRALHVDAPTKKVVVELGAFEQGHNCGDAGPTFAVIPLP